MARTKQTCRKRSGGKRPRTHRALKAEQDAERAARKESEEAGPKKPARPSTTWRDLRTREDARVAAGDLLPRYAWAAETYPDAFLDPLDTMLAAFEDDVALAATTIPEMRIVCVYPCIKKLVLSLKTLENYFTGDEHEPLIEYMCKVVEFAGIRSEDMEAEFGSVWDVLEKWWELWCKCQVGGAC